MKMKKGMWALSVFLTLLIVSLVVVPVVSAEAINWELPELKINDSLKPVIVQGELSPDENVQNDQIIQMIESAVNPTISKIPYGSIIQSSKNGMTRVFDSTGKQLFVINDADTEKVVTPGGYRLASMVHQVPDGSIIRTNDNVTTVYSEGERILTVLNPDNLSALPGYDGRVESARDKNVSEPGPFVADWTMPLSPPADTTDFLSNDILSGLNCEIIQPVFKLMNRRAPLSDDADKTIPRPH